MAIITLTLFLVLLGQLTAGVPLDHHYAAIETAPRIVGGVDAAPDNLAPHMMALVLGDRVISLICGAAIVSNKHALTAAHCVDAMLTWDQQGLSPTSRGVYGSQRWDSTEQHVLFSFHVIHPDWDPFHKKNDIGLLEFHEDYILTMSKTVAAIPLGTDFVGGGVDCYVTGWGRLWAWGPIPDYLQYINVSTTDGQTCSKGVNEGGGSLWVPAVDQRIEICTLHPKGVGYGLCDGDSGSALVCNGSLVGVVAWGFPCANGFPDMYSRVSAFVDWLHKYMK